MSIEEHIKPIPYGSKLGFPPMVSGILKHLTVFSNDTLKHLAEETYHRLIEIIERGMSGKGIKTEEEDKAGEYISHLILDAAYVHHACCRAGINVGDFPFDYLVDKLLPPREGEKED